MPVSIVAGLVTVPLDVSPRTPGSVDLTDNSTNSGSSNRLPGKCGDDAGQSTPGVLRDDGLRADAWPAAVVTARDGIATGAGDDDTAAAAEDRRAGSDRRAEGVAVDGVELSATGALRTGVSEPAASD